MNENITPMGVLYLIPTPLGDNSPLEVLPLSVKKVMEEHKHFIIENEKAARQFIKRITPNKNQDKITLYPLNKYTTSEEMESYLDPCKSGISMGLFSDAGCPGIADPGALAVSIAQEMNIEVIPLVGPSSILLALMGSGFSGQNFTFHGYLPIDKKDKRNELRKLENMVKQTGYTQIFMETPYRNEQLLTEAMSSLNADSKLCIATDIGEDSEFISTRLIKNWKEHPNLHKRPTVFALGR